MFISKVHFMRKEYYYYKDGSGMNVNVPEWREI